MKGSGRQLRSESGDGAGLDESLQRVLAGRGSGLPCAHCQELITATELEYEIIEHADAADVPVQRPAPRLHLRCYESWRAMSGRS